MSPPDFAYQTAEPKTRDEQRAWFSERMSDLRQHGATWARMSIHPEDQSLCLVEGWKVRPETEPPPNFFLQPTEGGDGEAAEPTAGGRAA